MLQQKPRMAKKTAVGIDIGTHQIKVVVATQDTRDLKVHVLGTGMAQSRGIRHGYVINKAEIAKTLRVAIAQAEKASGDCNTKCIPFCGWRRA